MGINVINYALAKNHSGSGTTDYDMLENVPIKQIGYEGGVTEITSLNSGLYRIIGSYSVNGEVIDDSNNNSLIQISTEKGSILINDPDYGIKEYNNDGENWNCVEVDDQVDSADNQSIIDLFNK